jgi:hypothetical protein
MWHGISFPVGYLFLAANLIPMVLALAAWKMASRSGIESQVEKGDIRRITDLRVGRGSIAYLVLGSNSPSIASWPAVVCSAHARCGFDCVTHRLSNFLIRQRRGSSCCARQCRHPYPSLLPRVSGPDCVTRTSAGFSGPDPNVTLFIRC